jgi:hypothetical protein
MLIGVNSRLLFMEGMMGKTIVAVLAGAVVWAVLWIGGNAGFALGFPEIIVPGEPLEHVGILVSFIVYGALLSVLAGYTTAAVKGVPAMPAVKVLGGLQLALGLFFEATNWALLPVWYHVVFLAMIVPATLYGGRMKAGAAG